MQYETILVTTTINVPTFLQAVCENARNHGRQDLAIIVIGDVKTPNTVSSFCDSVSSDTGITIDFYDLDAQRSALVNYPELLELMPLNSGSRKMIGNFLAYLKGCERLIMLDDDNFVLDNDFFGSYDLVGKTAEIDLIDSESGWYNIYEALIEKNSIPFYPRGFPWSERGFTSSDVKFKKERKEVVLVNGLVLNDPDIDALSRLFWPIRVTGVKSNYPSQFGLHPGTWSSFNNQNTAISKELVPVYFTPPSTGRNSDIWTAFVICRVVNHMDSVVVFGAPLVEQVRNPHNLWDDLDAEIINNRANELFIKILRTTELSAPTYIGALEELLRSCLGEVRGYNGIPEDEKEMMVGFFEEYLTWVSLIKSV